jgi:hypothetical protein
LIRQLYAGVDYFPQSGTKNLASGFELREGSGTILLTIKVYGAAEKRRVNRENTKTESNTKKVMDIVERLYGFLQYFLSVLCVTIINELLYRNVHVQL